MDSLKKAYPVMAYGKVGLILFYTNGSGGFFSWSGSAAIPAVKYNTVLSGIAWHYPRFCGKIASNTV